MIVLTNYRNFYKNYGIYIGAGYLSLDKNGVFVLVSKFYSNQNRFTSSSSNALIALIKPVYLRDNNNEELKIGDSIYSFKFTPLFMALYDKLYNKEDLKELSLEKIPTEKKLNFGLIALPIRYINNTFMPTGAHNHINVVIYMDDLKHTVLAFGFLTTQKIGLKLAKYQFDIFKQKVSAECYESDFKLPPNLLPQRFLPFKNMREFTIDSIKILKHGTEYIQQVSDLAMLYDSIKTLKIKPIHKGVDGRGISLEEIFEVCKAFDYYNHNNIPQPKTYTQIQQDKKNKIAMALKVLKKNEENLSNTILYEN